MTTKNNRPMNVIAKRAASVFAAFVIAAFSVCPVHALSYSLGYLDNGDGTLYDEETGAYVDMDTYHAAYGYEYNADYDAYGYWNDGYFYTCNCTACNYWKEGHRIVVPGNEENSMDTTGDQSETAVNVHMLGKELDGSNLSGDNWSYEPDANKLTLESFNYEGSGLFNASDESGDECGDSTDEDAGEDSDVDDESWDDEDEWYDEDEEDVEEDADDETETAEDPAPIKGVIQSEGDLTLNLNGENYITITDEDSDASYAVNVAGELKIEGDGILYVKSATEEKTYGNVPVEDDATASSNSGNIITNDIDNNQTVNEAPVEQIVNEAPVTQNLDEGDVAVSNNNSVDMPDFSNSISLPGASNSISFNPSIKLELPQNAVEKTVLSGMQQRHPEMVSSTSASPSQVGRTIDANSIKTADASQTDTSKQEAIEADGIKTESPKTGDDIGLLMALIATIVIGGITGGVLLRRRIRGY